MTTSSLLKHGPGHVRVLVDGLTEWMERKGVASVSADKASMSQKHVADPTAFERANYVKIVTGWH